MNNDETVEFIDTALICVNCGRCYETYSKEEGIPLLPDILPQCECGCIEFEIVED
jgi:uncharacterized protein YbaR (Trm112 family)